MLTPERPRNGECGPDFCPIGLSERFSALETAVKINGETQNKLFEELNRRLFGNGQPGELGSVKRRVADLEKWKWQVAGAAGALVVLWELIKTCTGKAERHWLLRYGRPWRCGLGETATDLCQGRVNASGNGEPLPRVLQGRTTRLINCGWQQPNSLP